MQFTLLNSDSSDKNNARRGELEFPRGTIQTPAFMPVGTYGTVKSMKPEELEGLGAEIILGNTFHLMLRPGTKVIQEHGDLHDFMHWDKPILTDSGGFQVMSLVKGKNKMGKVIDRGVVFKVPGRKRELFTPEKSIKFQMKLKPDMVVVLDDFTAPKTSKSEARETVKKTIDWARRSKVTFEEECERSGLSKKDKPYLLAVVQGGKYQDLRREGVEKLVEIGFDGFGYGGWPVNCNGEFDMETARTIAKSAPEDYLLYGLGIGKPEDIVRCARLGYDIFDCVLPTRDARHGRLYVWKKGKKINEKGSFYEYLNPRKGKFKADLKPADETCDCPVCWRYSRAYLHHLFKIKEVTAMRLASIHNLRFYSRLMEELQEEKTT